MHDCTRPGPGTLSRRTLLIGGASTVAGATFAGRLASTASASTRDVGTPKPTPKPIPGGLDIPGFGTIHVFLPGPTDVTLPYSGSQLMGLDVEPCTITDFDGSTAIAYLTGQATGSDGKTYNLESDFRVFQGRYVAADGTTNTGTFGLI